MSTKEGLGAFDLGVLAFGDRDKEKARAYFRQAAIDDPANEHAWGWMANVAETLHERIYCLRRVLDINPENTVAAELLRGLGPNGSLLGTAPLYTLGPSSETEESRQSLRWSERGGF